jgi:N-acetylneuraminic acid mutarotase
MRITKATFITILSFCFLLTFANSLFAGEKIISLELRIASQKAIDEVYWRHMIWPVENRHLKPALESVLTEENLRMKTEEYLRKSHALESFWSKPISPKMLQSEMSRMAKETANPALLRELWGALDYDARLIAECLARPILVDRFSEELEGFEDWWERNKNSMDTPTISANYDFQLPQIRNENPLFDPQAAAANSWKATPATGAPGPRQDFTAVWTGTEMIVWGGYGKKNLKTGARYNPATNSWKATSRKGINARSSHTAIWTGTHMIVWGGANDRQKFHTGGLYDPITNTWKRTSTVNAPEKRNGHSAVWTGSKMIIWSGSDSTKTRINSGGLYDPSTNSWTSIATSGAPEARTSHTAIWSGDQMIIWGGSNGISRLNSGGRYSPASNVWQPVQNVGAPSARTTHTAVWTGKEMIIWGGADTQGLPVRTGGRYDPLTNSWKPVATKNAPSDRLNHTAVWTGTAMIVWGGSTAQPINTNTGGIYNPVNDSWKATNANAAPSARRFHRSVWTGNEMVVWGGYDGSADVKTGSCYTP